MVATKGLVSTFSNGLSIYTLEALFEEINSLICGKKMIGGNMPLTETKQHQKEQLEK